MAGKMIHITVVTILIAIAPVVISHNKPATADPVTPNKATADPVPPNKAELDGWFQNNVKPCMARKDTLDPALVTAEAGVKVIKVGQNGGCEFRTVTDAVNSIPAGNTKRVIVWIGGGTYTEKIKIDRTKPFVTFYGAPNDVPTLSFAGTGLQHGTVDSATLIVESDYFNCVNVIIANSAPRPYHKRKGSQPLALTISGDKAAFYNCKINGFQDTICGVKGRHFFKDCFIEGTIDFIFGSAKSIYLNSELHVNPGNPVAMIAAHAMESHLADFGYSFVHCRVTGTGLNTFLARAWKPFAKAVYAYTDMSDIAHPLGSSDHVHPDSDRTAFYGQYKCKGLGTSFSGRVGFAKQLSDADVKPFITLEFIEGSKWLLPPPRV